MNDLGASGLVILIQVFLEVPDRHAELIARDALILDILRQVEEPGITFDTKTVVIEHRPRVTTSLKV